ncbi:AAA family ATPase [Candidatus Bathyarchaeota archaeon]|nr:AAA family ATPase [Candidatus Bathyarchaeota archaeon]
MLIREVILENFMSYEYARVPLKPGVNVVCGPNGSGKSSLLLGICVALGETYTERSKRLSDLIRWGEERARVTLILDNTRRGGRRPLPQFDVDEVTLTRNLRRDGRYWFELNGRSIPKGEVLELLRGLGFDPDNMLIVMHQNMAEVFASVTPQERLRILERAVGYESFRADVLEARRRLKGILAEEENVRDLLERAKETLGHWREQYERLMEKRRLRRRLEFLQGELAWSRVIELEEELSRLNDDLERLRGELEEAEEELERWRGIVQEAGEELKRHRSKRLDLYEKRIDCERTIGVCRYALEAAEEELSRIEKLLRASEERRRRFDISVEALRERLSRGPVRLDDYFRIIAELEEAEAEAYESWKRELETRRREAERQREELKRRLSEAEEALTALIEELEEVEKRLDEASDRYVEGRIRLALLEERRRRLGERIEELEAEAARRRRELRDRREEAEARGPRVETGRTPEEILAELRKVNGILLGMADVSEEAEEMYKAYSKTYRELEERAALLREKRREVMEEVEERMKRWLEVTQGLLDDVNQRYRELLSRLQATGEVRLINPGDIEAAGVEIYVGFKGATPTRLDPYTHSGGERSTAVMAFLLALQQHILSPFRAVDEFDLHMDERNREAVAEFIVESLKDSSDQYMVITPSTVTFRGENVHILMVQKTGGSSTIRVLSDES